jgi:hypothetical protein
MSKQLELFDTNIYKKNGVEHYVPHDIDKKSWDIMVEYTCYFLTMIFFLAVISIVLMMIKDVI